MQQVVLIRQQPAMMPGHHEEYMPLHQMQAADGAGEGFRPPTLRIHMLGTFWIASERSLVTGIDMPRLQSLLSYLVLHSGMPQSRTQLASLLWPDSTEAQARTNLRNLLYKLRQALPHIERWLVVDRNTLLWQSDNTWALDVLDFEQAIARAEQATRKGDDIALHLALERAMELYRGDLLPGCYDEWVLPLRERLSQMFLDVLEGLLHLREREGDYTGAIRVAQRVLREDPLHEAGYRHLMHLHAASGNRVAVTRTYQICVTTFKRELAMEPTLKTRRVYEQLMQEEKVTSFTSMKRSGNEFETTYALHSGQR
jgi:DNA-binding SARP family transcriptional activator